MNPTTYCLERGPGDDIQAIYRHRSDGDWEFVACFCWDITTFPQMNNQEGPDEIVQSIVDSIKLEGDDVLIVWHNEPDFPSVYEWQISPVDELPGVNRGNKHADEEAQPKADPRADQGSSQAVPPSDAQGS